MLTFADVALALGAAAVVGLLSWAVTAIVTRPTRKQAELALNSVTALVARSNGYTLHLVLGDGREIGLIERSEWGPVNYPPGSTYTYAGKRYEVVDVDDEYPAAIGTLVLRPVDGD